MSRVLEERRANSYDDLPENVKEFDRALARHVLERIAELEKALRDTFPLIQEVVDRPLWGSLQGDWQDRVRQ